MVIICLGWSSAVQGFLVLKRKQYVGNDAGRLWKYFQTNWSG
ncbi:hypothetical protein [Lysinibacillus odysseyi]|nr:hypothetical protein [Lysinibacillus odysseyi]